LLRRCSLLDQSPTLRVHQGILINQEEHGRGLVLHGIFVLPEFYYIGSCFIEQFNGLVFRHFLRVLRVRLRRNGH